MKKHKMPNNKMMSDEEMEKEMGKKESFMAVKKKAMSKMMKKSSKK
mgnify:CR=1 FL=1